jgi:hypothetical protein
VAFDGDAVQQVGELLLLSGGEVAQAEAEGEAEPGGIGLDTGKRDDGLVGAGDDQLQRRDAGRALWGGPSQGGGLTTTARATEPGGGAGGSKKLIAACYAGVTARARQSPAVPSVVRPSTDRLRLRPFAAPRWSPWGDPFHPTRQLGVQGDERICLQLREGNVLGVVGLGPPQLLGEVPGPTPEHGVAEEADRHGPDAGEPVEGNIRRDLTPVHGLVQGRQRLGAQERRGEQLVLGWDLDLLTRQLEDDTAVDDESGHLEIHPTAHATGGIVGAGGGLEPGPILVRRLRSERWTACYLRLSFADTAPAS